MSNLKLEYTGTESIELMKQSYPNSWEEKIAEKIAMLTRMQKAWKLENIEDAYKRYMTWAGSSVSCIEMLSALQTYKNNENPNKQFHNRIKEIVSEQDQILLQQESLESMKNINDFDRRTLRQFYNEKQDKLARELAELTNALEIIDPNLLVIQGSLFGSNQ